MMLIKNLFEDDSVEGLSRKLMNLKAMLNDKATTDNEKRNAASLIKKVQQKFDRLYPNQKPITDIEPSGTQSSSFWDNMARHMSDAQNKFQSDLDRYGKDMSLRAMLQGEDFDGNPVTYSIDEIKPVIDKLKKEKRYHKQNQTHGDDKLAQEFYRSFDNKINTLMRKWLPDEYQKKKDQQSKSSIKGYEKRMKARKEADKRQKDEIKSQGHFTVSQANKEIGSDIISKINEIFKKADYPVMDKNWGFTWHSTRNIAGYLRYVKTSSLKRALAELSNSEVKKLYSVISKIGEAGGERSYTPAQKAKVLKAFQGK